MERPYVLPAIEALEQVGYRYRGNLGIEDRDWMQEPGGVRRNVYVTVSGCLSVRNHLGVRETLRAREDLREQYGTLKLELSQRDWENRDDYTAAKSEILQEILAAAGLGDADRAAIDAANVPDSPDS